MKDIKTLVPDIYEVVTSTDHQVSEENVERFGKLAGDILRSKLGKEYTPYLRMSNLGENCDRKLWYSLNTPEKGEPLPAATRIKFLYGDLIELLLLFLAEEAGHTVAGEQDELEINGVKGHRDAVIDGVLVDTKSASSFSFNSFKRGLDSATDKFGYLDQLNGYRYASQEDPLVTEKDIAAFFVADKQHGHLTVDIHPKNDVDYNEKVDKAREMLAQPEPPERSYDDEPMGQSGNRKLGTKCSYCVFKNHCWPNLRTFLYSSKPEFLTKVEKLPKVPEVNR